MESGERVSKDDVMVTGKNLLHGHETSRDRLFLKSRGKVSSYYVSCPCIAGILRIHTGKDN